MSRGTVLVIDDERDLVNLVRYNLESEGYEVLGALDGESGINLALSRSPDLILLDRMMWLRRRGGLPASAERGSHRARARDHAHGEGRGGGARPGA
jgi:CheY-like chemotaxis protein